MKKFLLITVMIMNSISPLIAAESKIICDYGGAWLTGGGGSHPFVNATELAREKLNPIIESYTKDGFSVVSAPGVSNTVSTRKNTNNDNTEYIVTSICVTVSKP